MKSCEKNITTDLLLPCRKGWQISFFNPHLAVEISDFLKIMHIWSAVFGGIELQAAVFCIKKNGCRNILTKKKRELMGFFPCENEEVIIK